MEVGGVGVCAANIDHFRLHYEKSLGAAGKGQSKLNISKKKGMLGRLLIFISIFFKNELTCEHHA